SAQSASVTVMIGCCSGRPVYLLSRINTAPTRCETSTQVLSLPLKDDLTQGALTYSAYLTDDLLDRVYRLLSAEGGIGNLVEEVFERLHMSRVIDNLSID